MFDPEEIQLPPDFLTEHIPMRRVVAAVLSQGIRDYCDGHKTLPKPAHKASEVYRWFNTPGGKGFSFDFCCQVLGINESWARNRVTDRLVDIHSVKPQRQVAERKKQK